MSFQAYLDTIKAIKGKSPEDFKKLAKAKNFLVEGKLNPKVKASEITHWLNQDFGLGHGHTMAIHATFKGKTE